MKKIIVSFFVFCILLLSGCEKETLMESDQYQYYYETLKQEQQTAYQKIYTAVSLREESVTLKDIDADELEDLYVFVRNDHPELFWMDNAYSYTSKYGGAVIELSLSYLQSEANIEKVQTEIDAICDAFLQSVSSENNVYQKIRKAYEFVIQNTNYVEQAKNDQNIQSVFLGKQSVCAGYARALQYLLTKMEIDCTYIEGESTTKEGVVLRHAWNMVHVEDNYYYIDPTWGDYEEGIMHACDAYFMMHSDDMLSSYKPSGNYELTKENAYNWAEEKGNYVTQWNEQQIRTLWKKANANKEKYIEMKCDKEVYDAIISRMQQGEMYEIMRQMGMFPESLYYVKNDALHTIEIFY